MDAIQHVLAFKQGTLSIDEYIEKFNDLIVQCNIGEPSCVMTNRYRAGLQQEIREEMVM